jgi:hypothetical protein
VLTLAVLHYFPEQKALASIILPALAAALVLTALAMLLQERLHRLGKRLRTNAAERFKAAQPAITVAAGAVLGVLVTLTSVGAGALGVAMLVYLYPFRLTPSRLVGTDLAHAVPLTLVAGLGHLGLGNIDFPLLASLLIGSVPGVVLGSWLSNKVSSARVRNAIAIVLAIVGLRLLF